MSDDGNQNFEREQAHDAAPAEDKPLFKLFVGNLSYQTTDEDLRQIFEKYGEVSECRVAVDKFNSRPRGFAFVAMTNKDEAEEAIKNVTGMDVGGRQIRVELATGEKRERRDDRGGDRRGGDRRDFRGRDDRRGGGGFRGGDRRDRSRSRSRSRDGRRDFGGRRDDRRGGFERRDRDDRRGGDFRGGDRRDRGRDSR